MGASGRNGTTYASTRGHFQQVDFTGTARMQTSYNGAVEGNYVSLPWGDGFSDSDGAAQFYGNGTAEDDAYHFAELDHDTETDTDHAQFRDYSPTQARWLSPDPYDGSYDFSNPQSFNRYAYVGNNPLSFTDPSGQFICLVCGPVAPPAAACGPVCVGVLAGISGIIDLGELLGWFKPSFHGTLAPRPGGGTPVWNDDPGSFGESLGIPSGIKLGSGGIAGVLGLPDAGCEFGACGSSFLTQTPINENKTLQQKIAELAAVGVFVGPFETKHSPFHPGQIILRDNNWFCSQHVALDQGSGSGGHPVTGESHYDLVNPWKLTPVTTYWHIILDLVPDKIQDRFPNFPTGSDLCK